MFNFEKKADVFFYFLKKVIVFVKSNYRIIILTNRKGFFLRKEEKKEVRDYWKKYNINIKNYRWHKVCTTLNRFDPRYLTYPVFINHILPYFNKREFLRAYNDKNILSRLFPEVKQPKIFYRDINGKSYDEEYNEISKENFKESFFSTNGEYLIKPSIESGNARGIKLLNIKGKRIFIGNKKISFEDLIREYKKDFLIQKKLSQTEIFNKISSDSLNTIGITTFNWKGKINILNAYMKFGRKGVILDNMALGGFEVGVDLQTGRLKRKALSRELRQYESHSDSKVRFEGIEIPKFKEIVSVAEKCHKKLLYFDFVVWDFALDQENNIYLIEPNLGAQSVNSLQINSGPLFGEFSDGVFQEVFLKKN